MTQADYDRASRDFYNEQVRISAGLINSVLRWWRTLSWRAVQTDSDALWETYRDMVSDARGRSHEAGLALHNRAREAAGHTSTFRGGPRDLGAEARQAATSFFVQTTPVTREIQRGRLDDPEFLAELDDLMTRAGTNLARDGGRLAEQGGRDALADARENDGDVIGYYRMTDADPCGFCAMLASRGLVYTEARNSARRTRTWLDEQDPDQYHPDCHCQTLPLFEGVSMPEEHRRKADEYKAAWDNTEGSGEAQLKNFRERFDADRRARRANER
ncbi:hypothetical protein CPT_Shaeky_003 [Streptomyces phage Shaeky]|uniref:Capsid maturation protease n=1 Tax=Streptomyces phage Shaeky TaxID=2767586 RepID=A0A873WE63_9CAUD|nr:hypothetical protein CPT_Shaeky_003 [Streptomyces phage Shaeky]